MSTPETRKPKPEAREINLARNAAGGHGHRNVELNCPFCGAWVRCYLWSLAGSGKKCPCGAKLTSRLAFRVPDAAR